MPVSVGGSLCRRNAVDRSDVMLRRLRSFVCGLNSETMYGSVESSVSARRMRTKNVLRDVFSAAKRLMSSSCSVNRKTC